MIEHYKAGEVMPSDWFTITGTGHPFSPPSSVRFGVDVSVTLGKGLRTVRAESLGLYMVIVDGAQNAEICFDPVTHFDTSGMTQVGLRFRDLLVERVSA